MLFIKETDTFGHIVVWTIYISHTDHFTITNGIEPGSDSKKTDKHAAAAQKLYVGA